MRRFLKSFAYAAAGIVRGFSERNFRVHICAVCFVSWLALRFYEFSRAEWAALLLTFAAVLSAELFNTAAESLCDKVSPEKDENIRRCKDCAAGAVLVCAIAALIIGIALFWNTERFSAIAEFFLAQPARFLLLGISAAAAVLFVFLPEKLKKKH